MYWEVRKLKNLNRIVCACEKSDCPRCRPNVAPCRPLRQLCRSVFGIRYLEKKSLNQKSVYKSCGSTRVLWDSGLISGLLCTASATPFTPRACDCGFLPLLQIGLADERKNRVRGRWKIFWSHSEWYRHSSSGPCIKHQRALRHHKTAGSGSYGVEAVKNTVLMLTSQLIPNH